MSGAVSCPDWGRLTAHRFDPDLPEPAGWEGALAHLAGCPPCRRRALAADPTLVFRPPAGAEAAAAPPPIGADPDEMRGAVAAMRRAGRVLPARAAAGRRPAAGWGRLAAAAALVAGVFTFASGPHRPGVAPAAATTAVASAPRPAAAFPASGAAAPAAPALPAAELAGLPVFEGIDRPRDAHVYQLDGDGMVVVMIVDETLDV